jgi:RHS repeat-associated protein
MQKLGARYYNPIMGRFISPDPMGFAGGQANLLEYSFDSHLPRSRNQALAGSAYCAR